MTICFLDPFVKMGSNGPTLLYWIFPLHTILSWAILEIAKELFHNSPNGTLA
jgi:hypothetical protein